MLSVGIKYSMCDLMCDVISYCAEIQALLWEKLNVYGRIVLVIKNLKIRYG